VPTEANKEIELEIAYVLFIDIVGYSRLLIEEQKERLNELTAIVLATPQVRDSSDEQLVRLPTGDGMALVFHHSAEEPARCALEIAEALRKHPELPVRMGIHSGPVSEVTDVSGRTNIITRSSRPNSPSRARKAPTPKRFAAICRSSPFCCLRKPRGTGP